MKKVLSVILAFALIFAAVPLSGISEYLQDLDFGFLAVKSSAASTSDLIFKLNSDCKSYYVSDCKTSASGALEIPSTYNGKPVTDIGYLAFYDCSSLIAITIPDSVTSIGDWAFYDCSSLASVTIPDGVTNIGYYAFQNCGSITSVTIGNGVTSIGGSAFSDCSSLTSVTIPDSVTSIGVWAFYNCSSLTTVTIPDSVTSIDSSAFRNCSSLTSVTIPDSVTSIGESAFDGCSRLTSVTIPDSVTSIGSSAFLNCSSLTSIEIPGSVTSIDENAFWGCSSLTTINVAEDNINYSSQDGALFNKDKTEIICCPNGKNGAYTVPNSVTSIGDYAFYNCRSLTSITIPDSVTSIGYDAFYNCSKLTSVTIPDSVTSIGENAFSGTAYYNNNANWENGVLYIGNSLIKAKTSLSGAYTVKDGTKCIADYAFSNCSSLTSVTIGNSVTSIGYAAFYDCTSLTSVTIPDSVTSIGEYAFYNCSSLTSVEIPDSVTSIGYEAFYGCCSLTSVTIGNSVMSIGYEAFYNCSKLTSVTIPDSVTSVGYRAFPYNCVLNCGCLSPLKDNDNAVVSHSFKSKILTQPTCTKTGIRNCKCVNCGYTFDETVPKLGHSFGEGVVTRKPTCTEYGEKTFTCTRDGCGYFYSDYVSKLPHTYGDWQVTKEATCKNDGEKTRICSVCKDVEIQIIKKLPHQMSAKQVVSCSEKCYTHHYCTFCGYFYDDNYTEERAHVFENDKCIFCNLKKSDFAESDHNYAFGKTYSSTIHKPGASGILIKFSSKTAVENEYDTISVKGSGDTTAQTFTGTQLAYKTVAVSGDTATITLESDDSYSDYGYYVTNVIPIYENISVKNSGGTPNTVIYNEMIESPHNYSDNYANSWTVTKNNAKSLTLHFSDYTETESGYDYIYIYDGDGNQVGKYSGTSLAGEDVVVTGDTAVIELTSDVSYNYYGFTIETVTAEYIGGIIDHGERIVLSDIKLCMSVQDLLTLPAPFGAAAVPAVGSCLGTGSIVTLSYNSENLNDYTVVINGDLDGDSVSDVLDIVLAERALNNHIELAKAQAYAANGAINENITVESYQNVVNMALAA